MPRTKPKKGKKPMLAADRRKTEQTMMPNPMGHVDDREAGYEKVTRVVDTIGAMRKRRQISDRQAQVASIYHRDYTIACGSIRCALDDSNTGGGGFSSRTPGETILAASQRITFADRRLGVQQGRIVQLICGEGKSIEEAAMVMYGPNDRGRARERDALHVGRTLREGLDELATHWLRRERRGIRGERADDAVPGGTDVGAFEPGGTAHYGGRKQ